MGAPMLENSPFNDAAAELIRLGFHVVPLAASQKFPAEMRGDGWKPMGDWPRFRERQPTDFEREIWGTWSGANIGVVLGSSVGEHSIVAVDIDAEDFDEVEEIRGALPYSPMAKRGRKGLTLFYRGTPSIKTTQYRRDRKTVLCELLTGNETRQTVVPPSIHPETNEPYVWLNGGPCSVADLPVLDDDHIQALEETLTDIGWNADVDMSEGKSALRVIEGGDNPFKDLNATALANLDKWIDDLELYDLKPARGGYEAVATWRESGTGRPVSQRKRNLSIQQGGIKDFGTGETYSPIDLVIKAAECSFDAAHDWLDKRINGDNVVIALDMVASKSQKTPVIYEDSVDNGAGDNQCEEAEEYKVSAKDLAFPEAWCFPPGIVGEISQWICDTARKPQPRLALAAALCVVGTAMGRIYAGPTRTGSHLYALGLAPTGAGKDHPLQMTKQIMVAAGMQQHIGPGEFISSTAVVNVLSRKPLVMCAMDEFGAFLTRINSRRAGGFEKAVGGMLRTAWSSSFAAMPTPEWAQKQSTIIHAPSLSIFGVSTPDEFFGALSGMDSSNGLLNRFLIFPSVDRISAVSPTRSSDEVPVGIVEGIKAIRAAAGDLAIMAVGQSEESPAKFMQRMKWGEGDAEAVYEGFSEDIDKQSSTDERYASFFSRAAEYAQRLAMIRAAGRGVFEIDADDMAWGVDISRACFSSVYDFAGDYVADSEAQARSQEMARILKGAKYPMTHRQLMKRLNGKYSSRDAGDTLKMLIEMGRISAVEKKGKRGPMTIVYEVA